MMKNLITNTSIRGAQLLLTALMAVALTACGGGNGSGGTPIGGTGSGSGGSGSGSGSGSGGGTTGSAAVAVSLVSNSGCPANVVSTNCPLTAKAVLTDSSGNPVKNAVVTFSNTLAVTVLSPSTGMTLTDSTGTATVQVQSNGVPNSSNNGSAGTISAVASVGTASVAGSVNYTIGSSSVTLSIVTPTSNPFNLNAYGSTSIVVQVSSGGSAYTAQPVTVSFSSSCAQSGAATLTSSSITSTANGQAVATYTDKGCANSDTVVASVSGASTSVVIKDGAPGVGSLNFVGSVPSDASIVFQGSGGSTRVSSAVLTFQLVDNSNNPYPNQTVSFTSNNTTIAQLGSTSGTTDSNGQVSTTVTAVGATGGVYPASGTLAVTAQATVGGSTVQTISSNVIVSTGVPIQAAMSMVPVVHNIEGVDYFGTTTKIQFFLADSNGNPVVDGTPVAATTNEGGIGSVNSSNPGCTTINGQCQLVFTTQNPISYTNPNTSVTQYGLATIIGTSTNNTTTPLTATTYVYMSGSYPFFYTFNGTGFTYSGNEGRGVAVSVGDACSANIQLFLSDEHGNPLAKGATIAATPLSNITLGTYSPTAIPDDGRVSPAEAQTASASLVAGTDAGGNTLTLPSQLNTYMFMTPVLIPITALSGCATTASGGTVDKSSAVFTLSMGMPASGSTHITTVTVKYPSL